jgi:putative membrane protein
MKLSVSLAALAGLFLAAGLIVYYGFGAVSQALLTAGWGMVAITLFHLVPMTFSGLAWRSLLKTTREVPPLGVFVWARWIREAVNSLLPVAQIGGELVGARVLTFRGAEAGVAGGSVVVDLTMEVVTQFLFTVLTLGLLVLGDHEAETVRWLVVGLMIAAPALLGFVLVQRWGLFRLLEQLIEKIGARWAWLSLGKIEKLDATIQGLHKDRRRLFAGGVFHLLSWILGAGEVWLALYFMESPSSIRVALLLEGLGQAVRSAAFAVPGALGVQEGGYVLLGGMLGVSPQVALALSLIKRVRELLLGLPGLLAWQLLEGRRLWTGIRRGREKTDGL